MLVIFGTQFYGEVDRHGGQRQLTRFFHIYYVPLVPIGTLWVTRNIEGKLGGHAVAMNPRSVVAGYARVWGPVAAVAAIATASVGGLIVAGALAGLCAWSWSWRSLRSARERRRSDFHQLALGTRCDPLRMEPELASVLQADVAGRWAQVADGRTPEDVARLGATTPVQAVLAYASLRLAARLAPPEHARAARADSERVLDAVRDIDELALEGGPYRAALPAQLPEGVPTGTIAVTDSSRSGSRRRLD
jgi:hypothetical protein